MRTASLESLSSTPKYHWQQHAQAIAPSKSLPGSFYQAHHTGVAEFSDKEWTSLQISCPDSPLGYLSPAPTKNLSYALPSNDAFRPSDEQRYFPSHYSPPLIATTPVSNYGSYHKMGPFSPQPSQIQPMPTNVGVHSFMNYQQQQHSVGTQGGGYPFSAATPRGSVAQSKTPRCVEPVDGYIYQVQFKRAHKNFILAPSAPRSIIPGDFVKVEADRGEDMGIVLAKLPAREFEEVIPTAGYRGRGFSSGQGERKYLFRLATPEERASLADKVADEEHALAVCTSLTTNCINLH